MCIYSIYCNCDLAITLLSRKDFSGKELSKRESKEQRQTGVNGGKRKRRRRRGGGSILMPVVTT